MRNEEILDSWKDISEYLDRDIRTCARWEKELGLPIYRFDKDSPRSKVFAYKSEIDEWLKDKANHKEIQKKPFLEKRWAKVGLVSAVVLFIAVFAALFIANGNFSSYNPENLSIAVLPYDYINFTEYEQYIPEGISKEINDNLFRLDNLKIINPNLLTNKDKSGSNLNDIIEKFHVNHFLKTQIEKDNQSIKISTQLVRREDDKVIWNLESDGRLERMFSVLDDICLKLHKKLNANDETIPSNPFNSRKIQDYTAYDNYLKGNHILDSSHSDNKDPWKLYIQGKYYQEKWTKESNDWAINFFSQAIELDESFSEAYTGLARCYANYLNFNWDYDREWLNKAEELLKKAEEINPESCEYYSTSIQVRLLQYLCFDEDTQEKAFESAQQAVQKYPGSPLLRALLGFCHYLRFGEYGNEQDFTKALELNEESYFLRPCHINNIRYAELLMLNRDFNTALIVCDGIQGGEATLLADFYKGEIYYYAGDLNKSEAIFQNIDAPLDIQLDCMLFLGMIAARKGDTEEAERLIQKFIVMASPEYQFLEYQLKLASIYMGLGKKEQGYAHLEDFFKTEIMDKTRYIYLQYIEMDRNFDNCREEERFLHIIQ
jgi:TolB-like protein